MAFRIDLDTSQIDGLADEIQAKLNNAVKQAAAILAPAVHSKVIELAQERLHSRRQKFVEAVHFKEEGSDVYVVSLEESAIWVDDGLPNHDMKPAMLASSKAKTAKDGSKYLVVPFTHGPGIGPGSATPAQLNLQDTLKKEMKRRNIPWGKIEKNADGTPKTGLLHKFSIMDSPLKTANGPGQGHGPVGAVKQGITGTPWLQGVRVYQKMTENPGGTKSIKRAVMTFRVVSSKSDPASWQYPGIEGANIFQDAYEWGQLESKKMMDEILDQVLGTQRSA